MVPRALYALIIVVMMLTMPMTTSARDWADVVERVERSVVRLQHPEAVFNEDTHKVEILTSTCTAFSINEVYHYFLTAYHCLNDGTADDLKLNKLPTRLLYANKDLDLAVITADLRRAALQPSSRTLRKGEQVGALGFGYGFTEMIFRAGYVSHPHMDFTGHKVPGQWLIFEPSYVGGMSGGPVFDLDGRVVGIVQAADGLSGFGQTIKSIVDATAFYWF